MNIIIFIALFIILFLIINMLYKRTNHYKNTINQLQKYMKGIPNNLEIVNTGSSYARYAFDYSYTSKIGFNFGLQSQSLSYDFRILKQYATNLKKGCVVLITLPNLIFGFLDYEKDHNNTKYYYFLNHKNIIGYSKFKYLTRIVFSVLSRKKNIFYIIKDEQKIDLYNHDRNAMSETQVYDEASLRVEGWKKQFKLNNTIDIKFSNELEKMFESTTSLLNEMIEYCLNLDFKPTLIIPPCSSILNSLLSEQFIKKVLYENIEKANTKKIPVLDYLYDERFQDYKLYINSDMLNKVGRDKFTEVVIKDLKKAGVLKGRENGEI